ncbi:recombination regulator RecX [Clostridium sp. ZS2-4]|uniref:recombination regulator RecX n=1 Tax=Clostridium sp. ZS2-4 TaxID=2987703 RepID=UPI00227C25A3|nr:recombination regulator RecX [Clostridium sp. ZS2-4]MCY6354976.1 recombination regulator RecX [Clostridium sp. ZS2-4]
MEKTITKIETQKKNKNRVNVFLDDEFAFSCSAELVYYHNLKRNKKINMELFKEIIREDNYLKAKNSALRIIEKTYKTEREMFEKLVTLGYDEKTSSRVMKFLKEYSFVDDNKYADMFIRDKSLLWGKSKIRYALLKKGISEEIVENGLSEITYDMEVISAVKLAEKRYNTIIKSESNMYKIYKKLGDYLASRGYEYNIINTVLNRLIKIDTHDINNADKLSENNHMIETLKELAEKRYGIISKSEKDKSKIYRKLGQYLMRRGYKWEDIKNVLKDIIYKE